MHAKYHLASCNVAGCDSPQQSLFLCDRHQRQYLTTESARILQAEVVALYNGTAAFPLRMRAYLWALLHYTTNRKVPFVEHFPLESLYLLHRRNLLYRLSKSIGSREENCRELNRLISDFDHPKNETLEDLKLRCARDCGNSRHAYNRPLEFSEQLREFMIFKPKVYGYFSSVALLFFVGTFLAEKILDLHIQFPINLSVPLIIVSYFVCMGLVVGGFVFLSRVNPVLAKAQSHRLYIEASDNRNAAEIALHIRDRFHNNQGLNYSMAAMILMSLVMLLTPWPLDPRLSIIEAASSAVAAVCALLMLYPAATVYLIYSNASVAMESLPQSRFNIDLYASDGRLGIGDLIDLLLAGICFNVIALVLLWIIGPIALGLELASKSWWVFAVYQVLIFPIALFRVAQLRRLWKVRLSVVKSVHQAVSDETKKLKGHSIAERNARQQNIDRLRWFPILTTAARGHIKELVTVVLIPIAILIADKVFTAWITTPMMPP